MAINKKLIHFNKKSTFNSQKLSANDANTQYQVGGTGAVQTGAPDINYQSIVYIKDSKEIWTHGQFYGSAASVAWSAITGKPSFATVATSGSYNDLSNKPTIPTSLPTPASLTFTGATTGTWNGSSAKTVNIPTYSNASTSAAGLMSTTDKSKLNGIASGAEVNQNAFSNVLVGSTTISADSKTDTLTLTAGSNITLTPNATNDSITIAASSSSYTLPTASSSTLGGIKVGNGLSISNGVLSTGNYVNNVTVGSPSTDWQSAYVPMTVSYRDGSTADRNISLPMASGGGTNGSAGLMSGADKKKLDGLSGGVPSKIEYNGTSVTCTGAKVVATTGDTTIDMNDSNATIDITIPTCTIHMETDVLQMSAGAATSKTIIRLDDGSKTIDATTDTFRVTGFVEINDGDLSVFHGNIDVANGNVSSSGGFFDTSDARVKTNVKELDASKADKVRLVEFDRTDVEHHGYGVIAQELEEVYPEMVSTDSEGFKSVNYNELAMVKIKYLEDKVARLEALVGRLLAE